MESILSKMPIFLAFVVLSGFAAGTLTGQTCLCLLYTSKNNIAQEYIDGMLNITSVPMLVVIVAAGLVGGLIGAVIGQKALKKHFIKAGLVSVK